MVEAKKTTTDSKLISATDTAARKATTFEIGFGSP
jgi:hypothetical protein